MSYDRYYREHLGKIQDGSANCNAFIVVANSVNDSGFKTSKGVGSEICSIMRHRTDVPIIVIDKEDYDNSAYSRIYVVHNVDKLKHDIKHDAGWDKDYYTFKTRMIATSIDGSKLLKVWKSEYELREMASDSNWAAVGAGDDTAVPTVARQGVIPPKVEKDEILLLRRL